MVNCQFSVDDKVLAKELIRKKTVKYFFESNRSICNHFIYCWTKSIISHSLFILKFEVDYFVTPTRVFLRPSIESLPKGSRK